MSGFTLCFDLMEQVGKQVEMKREKDTLDYWSGLLPKSLEDRKSIWSSAGLKARKWKPVPAWEQPVMEITCRIGEVVQAINFLWKDEYEVLWDDDRSNPIIEGEIWVAPSHLMLDALVEDIQDYIQDGWEEDPHFWGNGQIASPSFIKGSYWKQMLAEMED